MDNNLVIVIIVAVILAAAALWFTSYRRSNQLRARFGPEYQRTVEGVEGSTRKAEAELAERQRRVEALSIRPLNRDEHDRFVAEWRQVQADFVDSPDDAIGRADDLLGRVMSTRGYPVNDFERAAADLSVDHPVVVQHYRTAHEIALRQGRGDTDTEALRKAMIHYRELFDELVEELPPEPAGDDRRETEAKDGQPFILAPDERKQATKTKRQPKETIG